jgi:hypothetical protein
MLVAADADVAYEAEFIRLDAETQDALAAVAGTNEMALAVAAVVANDELIDADAQDAEIVGVALKA